MGWSFRESIKILPGIRLNFSRRGVGASIGPRGLHLGFGGGRAPRLTGGIGPLHYYRSLGAGRGEHRHARPFQARRSHFGLLALAVVLTGLAAAWFAGSHRSLNPAAPKPLSSSYPGAFVANPTTVLPGGTTNRRPAVVPAEHRVSRTEASRRREPPRNDSPR